MQPSVFDAAGNLSSGNEQKDRQVIGDGHGAAATAIPDLIITIKRLPDGYVQASALGFTVSHALPHLAMSDLGDRLGEFRSHVNRIPEDMLSEDAKTFKWMINAIFGKPEKIR